MYAEYCDLVSDNIMVWRELDDKDVSVYAIIVALYESIDFTVDDLSELEYFGNDCAGYECMINGRNYIVNSMDEKELFEHWRVVLKPTE